MATIEVDAKARREIVAACVKAKLAAHGDSNDKEIDLLIDALDLCLGKLGIQVPDVDPPAELP